MHEDQNDDTGEVDMFEAEMAERDATWTTQQLQEDFEVKGFLAPFVLVIRKSDGATGTLEFNHNPRIYFGFQEHK